MAKSRTNREIESLLARTLIPIEPREDFVRHLRARLVRYRGTGLSPVWAVALSVSVVALIFFASFGLALRVLLSLLAFLAPQSSQSTQRRAISV